MMKNDVRRNVLALAGLTVLLSASIVSAQPAKEDGDGPPPPPPPQHRDQLKLDDPMMDDDRPMPPPPRDDQGPDGPGGMERKEDRGGPRGERPRSFEGGMRERRGGGGEGQRGPGGPGGGPPLTDAQVKEAMDLLREFRPEMAKRIEEYKAKNPDKAQDMMRPMMGRLLEMAHLKRTDPELFKLRVDDFKLERGVDELAGQVRDARRAGDTKKADDLTAQLKTKLSEQFDLRQKLRERELANMEKHLAEMRQRIETRKNSRDELIKSRLDEVTGASTKPEW
ncbi:MAG: hypothetical protein K8S99_04535 [Planctomycetes bacterium]|nr:hypothetical protein [Planctomycetota bacterium]